MSDFTLFQQALERITKIIEEKPLERKTIYVGDFAADIQHYQKSPIVLTRDHTPTPASYTEVILYTVIEEKSRIPASIKEIEALVDAKQGRVYRITGTDRYEASWPRSGHRQGHNYTFTCYWPLEVTMLNDPKAKPMYYFYYQGQYVKSPILPQYELYCFHYADTHKVNGGQHHAMLKKLIKLFGQSSHPDNRMSSRIVVSKHIGDIIGNLVCAYAYS